MLKTVPVMDGPPSSVGCRYTLLNKGKEARDRAIQKRPRLQRRLHVLANHCYREGLHLKGTRLLLVLDRTAHSDVPSLCKG